MRQFKLLWAAVGASVLLGALVTSASAGRISISSQRFRAGWSALNYSGGFGTIECEVSVEGSFHSRSITKTAGSLVGYITTATVNRCARGGATVLRETLPWHVQYESFSGTLPNITSINTRAIGISFMIREPTFGVTCLARTSATNPATGAFNLSAGVVTLVGAGGTFPCGSFSGSYSGNSSSVGTPEGTRITVTLI